jgi:hypothetical protein
MGTSRAPREPRVRGGDWSRRASREVRMSLESREARMDSLERRVDALERLPQRMDALEAQIVRLRQEMRSEFSAIRGEMREGDEDTRRTLATQMRDLFEANERHMQLMHEDLVQRIVGNETHMRVLHEDLVQRIATIKGG